MLITGRVGFIGCNLAQSWQKQGRIITVYVNPLRQVSERNWSSCAPPLATHSRAFSSLCATLCLLTPSLFANSGSVAGGRRIYRSRSMRASVG